MTDSQFQLSPRRRITSIVIGLALFAGCVVWAAGVVESSDMSGAPFRVFAGVGAAFMAFFVIGELIGLRHTEIVVSEEGIVAPHGWGRRPMSLAWDAVAELEVYRVPYGEVLSLRPAEGKTMRIGLAEVDDPDGLWKAVATRWDATHGDTS